MTSLVLRGRQAPKKLAPGCRQANHVRKRASLNILVPQQRLYRVNNRVNIVEPEILMTPDLKHLPRPLRASISLFLGCVWPTPIPTKYRHTARAKTLVLPLRRLHH